MFLEAEVYPILHWGFWGVLSTQFIFVITLWYVRRFDVRSFVYLLIYLILFGVAGNNLLTSLSIHGNETSMASEEASVHMAIAGFVWVISVFFLLSAIFRLVRK
ncbi:hypothetical protein [Ferdinandcohnia sp. Marseille-Q9671]